MAGKGWERETACKTGEPLLGFQGQVRVDLCPCPNARSMHLQTTLVLLHARLRSTERRTGDTSALPSSTFLEKVESIYTTDGY